MKRLDHPKPPPAGDDVVRVDLPGRDPTWLRAPTDPIHCAAILEAVGTVKGVGPQRAAMAAVIGYCWVPVTERPETPRPDLDATEPRTIAMVYGAAVLRELLAADPPWSFGGIKHAVNKLVPPLNVRIREMADEAAEILALEEAAQEREGFTGPP